MDRFCAEMARDVPPEPAPVKVTESGANSVLASTFYNNCGLCAIPRILRMGVQVLKVPARGASWQKIPYLEAVRAVADNPDVEPADCRELVHSAGFCQLPEACYYHLGTP